MRKIYSKVWIKLLPTVQILTCTVKKDNVEKNQNSQYLQFLCDFCELLSSNIFLRQYLVKFFIFCAHLFILLTLIEGGPEWRSLSGCNELLSSTYAVIISYSLSSCVCIDREAENKFQHIKKTLST